ncbi:TonB-dependent receptor [Chitinophaga sp. 30R24]|uniref:TonB-dependent receptor n=1 Tax=Chitinophaga sp. 30R24 TaxID=3248838 RepID=UPI003B902E96
MARILFLLTLLTSIHSILFAQREIKGFVYDKDTRKGLPGASISLYTADKSIMKGQAISDETGNFSLKDPPLGDFNLIISFMGYVAARIQITISENRKIYSLSSLQTGLAPNPISLTGISIKANKPLISIRKDTIEFSASDFRTAENASLKNLLQKIPGLTVDAEGNFYFQGKHIKELYVDGRPVFQTGLNNSGDPQKIAQVLMSNIVDKIQLTDKKGLDGMLEGNRDEKVINITVKAEMKKGINGSAGGGYGTHQRYNTGANANMFRDNKQIILIGTSNNVNASQGPYSVNDTRGAFINMPGITSKNEIKGNGSFDLSKQISTSFNISHTNSNTDNTQQQKRENILPDSNFLYNNNSSSHDKSRHDDVNLAAEIKPNEHNRLSFGVFANQSNNDNNANSNYISLGGKTMDTINIGTSHNTDNLKRNRFSVMTFYNHSFGEKGGALNTSINLEQNDSRDKQINYTNNYLPEMFVDDTINQQVSIKTKTRKINGELSYIQPLSRILSLNTAYSFDISDNTNDQRAYDFDNTKMGYDILNTDLTYNFKNTLSKNTIKAGIFFNKNKILGQLTIAYNLTGVNSHDYTNNKEYRQRVNFISPSLNFSYKIDNYRNLDASFTRNTTLVNNEILYQPIISTKNPLYVQLGNPDLKPGINNTGAITYHSFSIQGVSFGSSLFFYIQQNAMANNVYSDSTGRQITKPINVNGNYFVTQSLSFGKRFEKTGITLNYNVNYDIQHVANYINQVKNNTLINAVTQMFSADWMYKQVLEIDALANMVYNSNKYSIQNNTNYDYLTYYLTLSANVYLPLNINVGAAAYYNENTSSNQKYTILNSWVSKTFLRNKSLQLKLYVYDLLKENKAIYTLQSYSYIEHDNYNTLTRYFLLSASYFFGKKKGEKPNGNPPQ